MMRIVRSTILGLLSSALITSPSLANHTIANSGNAAQNNRNNAPSNSSQKSSKPTISSAQMAENKRVQENLNYFGFNTGTPGWGFW